MKLSLILLFALLDAVCVMWFDAASQPGSQLDGVCINVSSE